MVNGVTGLYNGKFRKIVGVHNQRTRTFHMDTVQHFKWKACGRYRRPKMVFMPFSPFQIE